MRIFSLAKPISLETNKFFRHYHAIENPEAAEIDKLYIEVGKEIELISDKLKEDFAQDNPTLTPAEKEQLDPLQIGLQLIGEQVFKDTTYFPTRLGRISSHSLEDGFYFHQQAQVLPDQLALVKAQKPHKQHFRFAIVNGFGGNLGDCLIGNTAFRHVLQLLKQQFSSFACDVLFGPGTSAATEDILMHDSGMQRIHYQALTVAEFSQYDAYFDFTGLINMPKYDDMPTVDWVLWWCGLDPRGVSAEQKRNRGTISWQAWNAVVQLLKDKPGKKIFFNPKASVPLRSMHESVAVEFVKGLLASDGSIKVVVDRPLAIKHKRVINFAEEIDSPEKFKALIGQMDGVITVNSFASHVADMCSVPCVHLCSCIPAEIYPYYPFSVMINPPGYEALPAFKKVKVSSNEWEEMSAAYEALWAQLDAGQIAKQLSEKMTQRQQVGNEPSGLSLISRSKQVTYLSNKNDTAKPVYARLNEFNRFASSRFLHLTQHLLRPGSVCVLACAPEPEMLVTLAKRLAPYGELIVFEPRRLLARMNESALYLSQATHARVIDKIAAQSTSDIKLLQLDPWSESESHQWGNTLVAQPTDYMAVDELALTSCACLMAQAPMDMAAFLQGAQHTIDQYRPFLFMTPLTKETAREPCRLVAEKDYEFWAESALGNGDITQMLIVGVPKEKKVKIDGFYKIEVTE